MISKIKNIQGDGHWDSNYGRLYSFEYEFEDGTILKANHKTEQSPFQVGQEAEYEITKTNEYGKMGKVKKPEQQQSGSKQVDWDAREKKIAIGHSLNNSIQIIAAKGEEFTEENIRKYAELILKVSDDMNSPKPK